MKASIFFKRLRQKHRLNQTQLGEIMGVKKQYVSLIENDKVDYPLGKFIRLCWLLEEYDFEYLFAKEKK